MSFFVIVVSAQLTPGQALILLLVCSKQYINIISPYERSNMDTKILEKIGLTEGEVRVYLALLDLGSSSTGHIIDKSHITSSKVYVILERLEQKGLVSHVIKNNVKYFQVADPNRLLDYMAKKKDELEYDTEQISKIIPSLKLKREKFYELQETTMYQGLKGFQTSLQEFISDITSGGEFVVFGAKGPFGREFEIFIRHFYVEKEKKGIKTRLIYNSKYKHVLELYKNLKLTQVRFIDKITPSTVVITKGKVLIICYGDDPRQVLIKSTPIAESYYQFFESMWETAKA